MSYPATSDRPFFVVFDTCTHPEYYADVHRLLALPPGSVVSYDYKRYLWTASAAATMDGLVNYPGGLPVDALLIYGEALGYAKGQPDPDAMLRWDRDVFVPTRSARIVSASRTAGATRDADVLQFDLQLRGYIDPSSAAVEPVVRALEAEGALPFGDRTTQYRWVASFPEQLRSQAACLHSDDQHHWASVVDRLVTAPTQFRDDVFWRLSEVRTAHSGDQRGVVLLRDRATNGPGVWHRDYPLKESKRYEICVETHTPSGYTQRFPDDASIAFTTHDDDRELIRLSANPLQLRPNSTLPQRFSIGTDDFVGTAYAGIQLETQRPDHTSRYGVGSQCTVTVAVTKQRGRFVVGTILLLAAVAAGCYAGFAEEANLWWRILVAVGGALVGALGGLALKRQFTISAKGAG